MKSLLRLWFFTQAQVCHRIWWIVSAVSDIPIKIPRVACAPPAPPLWPPLAIALHTGKHYPGEADAPTSLVTDGICLKQNKLYQPAVYHIDIPKSHYLGSSLSANVDLTIGQLIERCQNQDPDCDVDTSMNLHLFILCSGISKLKEHRNSEVLLHC